MDIFIPDLGKKIPIEKALELMTEEWCDNGEYSTQTVMDLVAFIKNLISNKFSMS